MCLEESYILKDAFYLVMDGSISAGIFSDMMGVSGRTESAYKH
jgi:hypothetical protein